MGACEGPENAESPQLLFCREPVTTEIAAACRWPARSSEHPRLSCAQEAVVGCAWGLFSSGER
jgi:hypothetical protein